MIVDTSALVAILYREPDSEAFATIIADARVVRVSVASLLELTIVVESQAGSEAARQIDLFIERARIMIEPVTVEQGALAREAFRRYGKGRHKASLNFGDCFSYGLAKAMDEPMLFKGNDFARTDIASVINPS